MGFSHGIFAPSFLSLLQTQQGSGQVLHRILTQGQKVPSVSFSGCLQPGCQRGFLQRDFWLLQILIFKSRRGQQCCCSCPRTASSGQTAREPCTSCRTTHALGLSCPAQGAMAHGCFLCSCRIFRASIARRYRSKVLETSSCCCSTTGSCDLILFLIFFFFFFFMPCAG